MEQIIELLKTRDRFVIAGHTGPDGDTIGSCLGLAMALDKLGKEAVVVLETTAAKYRIIPGRKFLYHDALDGLIVDVFIALDCADTERLGAAKSLFERAKTTICIDHHETNNGFAEYNFIDPAASSTAEMVFGVIEALTDIDADIATAIYSGIVGDTGGFRYSSTGRSTMETAARLMETGIPFTDIYSEMLLRHSFEAAKVFGLALGAANQAMDGRIVYTCVTREMLASVGADSSDLDTLAEYLMNTRGADVALFLYERHTKDEAAPEVISAGEPCAAGDSETASDAAPPVVPRKIKVSMRSRGLHVGRIAASLGGGGHRMAAGCTVVGTVDEILQLMLELLERELLEYSGSC
ncbi:MAG: bifunctional oligoribonuclease/PAP phosphatase NrnA [Defluviitaleaceae bacterium]|nr:bifunctional oligoribonuclease/PAP phosphatase NrnA [Defluviitaleaceae bacterium]